MNEQKPDENPYEALSTSSVDHASLPGRKQLTAGHWFVAVTIAIVIGLPAFVVTFGGLGLMAYSILNGSPHVRVAMLSSWAAGGLAAVFTGGLVARRYLRSR